MQEGVNKHPYLADMSANLGDFTVDYKTSILFCLRLRTGALPPPPPVLRICPQKVVFFHAVMKSGRRDFQEEVYLVFTDKVTIEIINSGNSLADASILCTALGGDYNNESPTVKVAYYL